jgi:hypothetical protein
MSGPVATMDVLVVAGGGFRIGLETRLVVRVMPSDLPADNAGAVSLAALLGVEHDSGQNERIVLLAPNGERQLAVDTVVGIQSLAARSVQTLPGLLRHVGVPEWIVGVAWLADEVVWLIDPPASLQG